MGCTTIISDQGPQFTSKFAKEVARILECKVALSTAYHPQTDGQMERNNQTIETFLRIYCAGNPEKWKQYLFLVEFAHNS
jgi:transposase InsO family protein